MITTFMDSGKKRWQIFSGSLARRLYRKTRSGNRNQHSGIPVDNPVYLMVVLAAIFLILFFVILSVLSVKSKNIQQRIAAELAAALTSAKEANEVKQNFFSKMSHDIRTPLNVV